MVWNNEVHLILADVDQTVADDFLPATPAMVDELTQLLKEERSLFFVTGSPFNRFMPRISGRIPAALRHRIVVSHCSGAEVWGFDKNGEPHKQPFYSIYDTALTPKQKRRWREIVSELITIFKLEPHPPMPVEEFRETYGDNPFAVMFEDRGPQITLEIVNAYDLSTGQRQQVQAKLPGLEEVIDLRQPLQAWVNQQLQAAAVPVTARIAGVFALDLAIAGVSKAESVKQVMDSQHILEHIGLGHVDLSNPAHLEIWGDRFDQNRGTDWLICQAVDPQVRAIDFRAEDPTHFPVGYNIVLWDGQQQLEAGALEYLQSRH